MVSENGTIFNLGVVLPFSVKVSYFQQKLVNMSILCIYEVNKKIENIV